MRQIAFMAKEQEGHLEGGVGDRPDTLAIVLAEFPVNTKVKGCFVE